jgi:hypothetical protein
VARLSAVVALIAVSRVLPAHADPVDRWSGYVAEASARFGIPASWITRVIRAESGGRTMFDGSPIVSRAGAIGLMQLMPATWAEMRAALKLGADAKNPHDNIMAGTYYLRLMYDRFGYPGLFGAYNAGPARYAAWLAGQGSLPSETRAYLANVAGDHDRWPERTATARSMNGIFFKMKRASGSVGITGAGTGLFVALKAVDTSTVQSVKGGLQRRNCTKRLPSPSERSSRFAGDQSKMAAYCSHCSEDD